MRVTPLFVLLALLAAAGQTQPVTDPPPAETKANGIIIVGVKDAKGRPVPGAWVILNGRTSGETAQEVSRSAAVSAGGQVRFSDLPNGGYRLDVRMAGHSLDRPTTRRLQLEGPDAEAEVDLILRRRPVLTGRVVDESGAPMYNAAVQALRVVTNEGEESLAAGRRLRTDDRGVFRTTLEEPGHYWVMATHVERSFPRGSAPQPTGMAFYPNSPDLLTAVAAELSFDQLEVSFDITLPDAPNTDFKAQVVSGPQRSPCIRCNYSLRRVEGAREYELVSGSTGRRSGLGYRGIPAGQYRIYLQDNGDYRGWWAISEVTVPEGRPVKFLITTGPPVMVTGRVTLENPPPETLRLHRERKDAIQVNLQNVGDHFFHMQRGSTGRAELPLDRPEITLGPMSPEKFRLEASISGGYLASVSRGGRSLASPILDFSQPGGWTDLNLEIRFDRAEPDIRVRSDGVMIRERPSHRLVLVPDAKENGFGQYYETECVGDERCYASPLPPGLYWAIALPKASGRDLDLRDPKLRAKFEAWGTNVQLIPGKNPPVELVPMTAEVLRGL